MSAEPGPKGSHWQPSTELVVLGGLSAALTAGNADVQMLNKSAFPAHCLPHEIKVVSQALMPCPVPACCCEVCMLPSAVPQTGFCFSSGLQHNRIHEIRADTFVQLTALRSM